MSWGILEDKLRLIEGTYTSLRDILTNGQLAISTAKRQGTIIPQQDIELLSPVTEQERIYCQGKNYGLHRIEAGFTQQKPPYNLLFTKAASTLTSVTSDIVCPPHVRPLGYEIELGLIMKQDITEAVDVTDCNLADYVAGFVVTNDVSARDVQICEQQ